MRKTSSPWLKIFILNRFLAVALSAAVLIGTASSLEWGDIDSITVPFARIGAW